MTGLRITLCIVLSFAWCSSFSQFRVELLDTTSFITGPGVVLHQTSFRGLCVVNDRIIWVSGSRGTIGKSTDGGKTFTFSQLGGYAGSDFRDIEAFDAQCAVIMSSGTPACILKTTDGGATWKEVYRNTDSAYFFDAMDFWDDRNGMLVGDPINGRFVLLQTRNGGDTWTTLDNLQAPEALEGEAIFAASGTSLRCWNKHEFGFVTGGSKSRFFRLNKKKKTVAYEVLPMIQGESSQGTFSFAYAPKKQAFFFTGGNYRNDKQTETANFCYRGSGKHQQQFNDTGSIERVAGYKSCIQVTQSTFGPLVLVTGTSGTAFASHKCSAVRCFYSFTPISEEPFHVIGKAKAGKAVFLAGPRGRIARLKAD